MASRTLVISLAVNGKMKTMAVSGERITGLHSFTDEELVEAVRTMEHIAFVTRGIHDDQLD